LTQDEIIEMARQVGMDYLQYISPEAFEKVTAFCKLVAQHEREACAEIAENWNSNGMPRTGVANEIRARGRA